VHLCYHTGTGYNRQEGARPWAGTAQGIQAKVEMHGLMATACQAGSQAMRDSWRTAEPAWSMSAARQEEESVHRIDLAEAQKEAGRTTVGFVEAREMSLMCLNAARWEVR